MLEPGQTVDRYRVIRRLGQGGMAVVFLVEHQPLGSLHAMKLLQITTPSMRARALQEGRIQATLRHPNVVSVTDVVGVQGAPALVMDVIRGPSLEQYLLARRPTWGQADALGRGILAGVRAAHQAGRIHRDLKPANVLLEVEDDQVVPKVADFGLAKILDSQNGMDSRTGVLLGTPAYMAPEQYRNAKGVDHRADIFSLGALLYELVTGMTPYGGTDLMELYDSIQGERYTPPRGLVSGLPQRMDDAICQALSPLPDARPQSVDALLQLWTGGSVAPVGVWNRANCDDLLSLGLRLDVPPRTDSETYVFDDGSSSEGLVERLVTAAPPAPTGPVANSDTLAPEHEPALPEPEPDPEPEPEPESERAPAWIPWAAGGALVLVLAGVGLWASGVLQPAPTPTVDPIPAATPSAPSPEAPVLVEPREATPGPQDPEPEPAQPAQSGNQAPADPPPAEPEPVEPEPVEPERTEPEPQVVQVTEPAPAQGTRWQVSGVERAYLVGADGAQRKPGSVTAGSYALFAFFDDAKATKVMDVHVAEGANLSIVCNRSMRMCQKR